jgi:hypothetical protein
MILLLSFHYFVLHRSGPPRGLLLMIKPFRHNTMALTPEGSGL